MDTEAQIINRLYEALEAIDAPLDLLQIVGSWGDTVSQDETLMQLDDFITRTTGKPPRPDPLDELKERVRAILADDRA